MTRTRRSLHWRDADWLTYVIWFAILYLGLGSAVAAFVSRNYLVGVLFVLAFLALLMCVAWYLRLPVRKDE